VAFFYFGVVELLIYRTASLRTTATVLFISGVSALWLWIEFPSN